jgi:hypothetical protein
VWDEIGEDVHLNREKEVFPNPHSERRKVGVDVARYGDAKIGCTAQGRDSGEADEINLTIPNKDETKEPSEEEEGESLLNPATTTKTDPHLARCQRKATPGKLCRPQSAPRSF